MITTNTTIQKLFQSNARQVIKITFGNTTITEADIKQGSFTIDNYSMSTDRIEIGSAIAAQLKMTLNNSDGRFNNISFQGKEMYVQLGVKNWEVPSSDISWIPLGYFTPMERPKGKTFIEVTALDRMVTKFDKLINWTYFSFPCTVSQLSSYISTVTGMNAIRPSSVANLNYTIAKAPKGAKTYRDLIRWIAFMYGLCAVIDEQGRLRYKWYTSSNFEIKPADRYSHTMAESDVVLSGLHYTDKNGEHLIGTDDYTVEFSDCGLLQDNIDTALTAIWNKISGFAYRPCECVIRSAPFLQPFDMYSFYDTEGTAHPGIVSHVTFTMNASTAVAGRGESEEMASYVSPTGIADQRRSAAADVEEMMLVVERNFQEEIEDAVEQIKSGSNGDIEFTYNAEGKRSQMLAMDSSDLSTAKKILLINAEGIAGFTNGLDDPSNYRLAITTDGKVNVEALNTGVINAQIVIGSVFKIGGSTSGSGSLRIFDDQDAEILRINKSGYVLYDTNGAANVTMNRSGFVCDGTWSLRRTPSGLSHYYSTRDHTGGSLTPGYMGWSDKVNVTPKTYCQYDVKEFDDSTKTFLNYVRMFGQGENDGFSAALGTRKIPMYQIYAYDTGSASSGAKRKGTFGVYPGMRGATVYSEVQADCPAFMMIRKSNGGTEGSMSWAKMYQNVVEFETFSTPQELDPFNAQTVRPVAHMFFSENSFRVGAYNSEVYSWGEDYDSASPADIESFHLYATQNAFYHSGKKVAHESSSSRRYKHDIKPLQDEALDPHKLLDLPIRQAVYNEGRALQYNDMAGKTLPVFIAEEVDEIYPSATIHDPDTGLIENWDERRIIPGMLALIQEQAKKIEELETRIAVLEGRQ